MNLIMIISSVLLNAMAQLFLKKGMILIGDIAVTFAGIVGLIPKAILNP